MSELRDRLSVERRMATESSSYLRNETPRVFVCVREGAPLEGGPERVPDRDAQERYQEGTPRKGMRNAGNQCAPHQRRRMSVPNGIGIVGTSHAYPTYPCRKT